MLTDRLEIENAVKSFATRRDVYNEMAEPILIDDGDVWWVKNDLFCCVNIDKKKLKYLFVETDKRSNGVGSKMLKLVSEFCQVNNITELSAVCPSKALDFYLRNGWVIISSFKNYHKIKLNNEPESIISNFKT